MGAPGGNPTTAPRRPPRPRREDWERMAVLHLVHRGGHGIRHAARLLRLPKSTVHGWVRQGPPGIRDERLRAIAQRAVDESTLLTASEEAAIAGALHRALPPGMFLASGNAGNPKALQDWYDGGADGQIDWGSPGDFEACVRIAGKHISDAEGFCQERHIAATGSPAGKAPGERMAEPRVAGDGCGCCGDCHDACDGGCCGDCSQQAPDATRVFFDPSEARVAGGPGGGEWTSGGGASGVPMPADAATGDPSVPAPGVGDGSPGSGSAALPEDQALVASLQAQLKAARSVKDKALVATLTADLKAARAAVRADHAAVRAAGAATAAAKKAALAQARMTAADRKRVAELRKLEHLGRQRTVGHKVHTVRTGAVHRARRRRLSETSAGPSAAGLAVQANDTGRVLMLQRAYDPGDPAGGDWEWPGGRLEPGEDPLEGARREWQEEVGAELPDGEVRGSWRSADGVYEGFSYLVDSEADVETNAGPGGRAVKNPDDPDGDQVEVVAWWDPDDLPMPAMRGECADQWPLARAALRDGADEPQGVMVAFFLPPDTAEALALDREADPTALPPSELHLTLAFLGRVDDVGDPGRLARVVAGFAAVAPPVEAAISGTGRFATGERTVYASVDAPALPAWRQRLVEHLRAGGFEPSTRHGYTPHVSLCSPDGPVTLEVEPLEFTASTLTLAYGGARMGFALEGGAMWMAEPRAGSDTPRRPERPDPDVQREKDLQDGQERAQRASSATAENRRQVAGPGEPGDAEQPVRTETADVELDQIQEGMVPPPIMDKRALEAWHRYITAIANDVPHSNALRAAAVIDPDFVVTDVQARRIIHALGKGQEPVRFGWSAGSVAPPPHVTGVYDDFQIDDEQERELAQYLDGLAVESYLEGINAQLVQLGLPIVTELTDPAVLQRLAEQSASIAEGIVETYGRDLAHEVYTTWIEHRSQYGRQSSRRLLWEAVSRWAEARASDRADMVSITEVGRFYNLGVLDFLRENSSLAEQVQDVYVMPDECECERCQDLVGDNPYTPGEAMTLPIPVHPRCVHELSVDWEAVDKGSLAGLWAGQAA